MNTTTTDKVRKIPTRAKEIAPMAQLESRVRYSSGRGTHLRWCSSGKVPFGQNRQRVSSMGSRCSYLPHSWQVQQQLSPSMYFFIRPFLHGWLQMDCGGSGWPHWNCTSGIYMYYNEKHRFQAHPCICYKYGDSQHQGAMSIPPKVICLCRRCIAASVHSHLLAIIETANR